MMSATGIGSMPGTSVSEAVAVVAGELPDLPHLVELPARGAGADMIGRTAALLVEVAPDFGLQTVPTGWQRTGGRTPEMRRARSWLGEDLDRAEQVFADSSGDFKIQICGPWTWAAGVEDTSGRRLVRDAGFMADLSDAWAAAAIAHFADVRRRLPHRRLVLQCDEPTVPAILSGRIPTRSGLGRLAAVPESEVSATLRRAVPAEDVTTILHCCDTFPFGVARSAGFSAISYDCSPRGPDRQPGASDTIDALAQTWESGIGLLAGAVPTRFDIGVDALWKSVRDWWSRTGLPASDLVRVGFSPACGLAGVTASRSRSALADATELHRRAVDGL